MDVFPVRIRANGLDIWLAWVEVPEAPPFLWNTDRRVFWAHQRSELQERLSAAGLTSENADTDCDIDRLLQEIRCGRLDDPQSALDYWNFLTDFSFSISEIDPGPYEPAENDLYDALFSLSSVAKFMEIPPQDLDPAELSRLASILERGTQMIIDHTIRRDH